jgi:hypothetical protein
MSNNLRLMAATGLGLVLASAAAPIALADPPGYYFQDSGRQSWANNSGSTAQIEAANRKADQALATALQAIREAQEAKQQQLMQQAQLPQKR